MYELNKWVFELVECEEIIEKAETENVEYVKLQFTNLDGNLKSMSIQVNQLSEALKEGIGFDGSSVPGYVEVEKSDLILMPDPSTYRTLPWSIKGKKIGRLFCNVCYPNGEPHEADPRSTLENYIRTIRRKGYEFYVGAEIEFYLFDEDNKPLDQGGYLDTIPDDKGEKLRTEMVMQLQDLGFIVEKIHHEVSPGQNELDLRYSDALTAADNILACRQGLKALGEERGIGVNYSPKPLPEKMGNGMHCHHSLGDSQTGENLFFNPGGKYRMSDLARHFLGGELEHAAGLTALAASVNQSYERLVPGYEAPVYLSWGGPNRTVMTRIPGYEIRSGSGMRLEYRTPDPLCNPYLLFTALLAAGMDGINRELDPGEPVKENIFEMDETERSEKGITTLPGTLHQALDALQGDNVLIDALGKNLSKRFIRSKRDEAVTKD